MNKRKVRVLYILWLRSKCKRRQQWAHPINLDRPFLGVCNTLVHQLREDEQKFFNFFRMSISSFDELLTKVEAHITKQDTNMREKIPQADRLAVTLRYLATGNSFVDLHYLFRMGVSTVEYIVKDVCFVLWNVLKSECFPLPTTENLKEIADGFEKRADFPNCIGAVDGKHVRLVKPWHSGSMFFNYKEYFSIVLMAVADSNYKFTFVDIGSYGKDADPTIFANTSIWKAIVNESIQLPQPKPLPGEQMPVPFVFVADEAFPLNEHVMRPYGGKLHNVKKRVFNYRLTRARRYIECAFGIMSNKWRIFHRPLNVSVPFSVLIVQACCVLHNFVRERDGYRFEDTLTVTGLYDIDDFQGTFRRGSTPSKALRLRFANYFIKKRGALPWQMEKI